MSKKPTLREALRLMDGNSGKPSPEEVTRTIDRQLRKMKKHAHKEGCQQFHDLPCTCGLDVLISEGEKIRANLLEAMDYGGVNG